MTTLSWLGRTCNHEQKLLHTSFVDPPFSFSTEHWGSFYQFPCEAHAGAAIYGKELLHPTVPYRKSSSQQLHPGLHMRNVEWN
jgi:hypothetical protein